jgi:aminoglycoside phosphotransferase (APT) family kinase protein
VIDIDLPQLAAAVDAAQMSRRLGWPVRAATLVRHKPAKRALVRYDTDRGPLLGKMRAHHRATTPFTLAVALRAAGLHESSAHGVGVPEPVAVLDDMGMWLQRWVAGGSATESMVAGGSAQAASAARWCATAAVHVHRAGVPARRTHSAADELRILTERLDRLARSRPDLAGRLAAVIDRCTGLIAELHDRPTCGIHRDYYPDQVILHDGVTVVDFDLYCQGDPAVDIGNFAGHLSELAVRELGDEHALDDISATFVDQYLRLAGASHRAAIEVYTTLTVARLVSLSTEIAGRQQSTEALLQFTEQRLASPVRQR